MDGLLMSPASTSCSQFSHSCSPKKLHILQDTLAHGRVNPFKKSQLKLVQSLITSSTTQKNNPKCTPRLTHTKDNPTSQHENTNARERKGVQKTHAFLLRCANVNLSPLLMSRSTAQPDVIKMLFLFILSLHRPPSVVVAIATTESILTKFLTPYSISLNPKP